jgi:hypothetical protein
MNQKQEEHFEALMALVEPLARAKYTSGAIEHTGVLGDLTDEQLFEAETEEIIDLLHYRLSRLLKRATLK